MNKDIISTADTVIANTYKRFPIVLARGKGCTVWDINEKAYTDFVSGIAVCNLGHADPEVAAVLARQSETLVHVSNLYYTIPQVELAEWLTTRSFADCERWFSEISSSDGEMGRRVMILSSALDPQTHCGRSGGHLHLPIRDAKNCLAILSSRE